MRYNKEIKNDMTRKLYFTILSLLFVFVLYAQYVPDVLGDGYLRQMTTRGKSSARLSRSHSYRRPNRQSCIYMATMTIFFRNNWVTA